MKTVGLTKPIETPKPKNADGGNKNGGGKNADGGNKNGGGKNADGGKAGSGQKPQE